MGLLDQVMGNVGGARVQQKPGLGSTVAAGVVLALLVKGVRAYQAHQAQAAQEGRSFGSGQAGAPAGASAPGGMLGGGLGSILGGLGGAGALGALISQFQQRGLGQQMNSWVGPGRNEPIAPDQVAHALGDDTLQQLQQQTGMPREALLAELAQHLPDAMHELTPDGRAPSDAELNQIAAQSARRPS